MLGHSVTRKRNNNNNGKYWAIIGPKLYGPPEDPEYRRTAVFSTTLLIGGSYTSTYFLEVLMTNRLLGLYFQSVSYKNNRPFCQSDKCMSLLYPNNRHDMHIGNLH